MSSQVVSDSQPGPTKAPHNGPSFLGHARIISILTLLSRLFGMARESLAAMYFGAGMVQSAFTVAFTIPNLFRKLFGEGALSAAFIPLYAQAVREDEHGNEANNFAAAGINLLCLILVGLTIIGELVLWGLGHVWAMQPDRLLTIKLTAIMLPYVVLVCGVAFLSGILQVHRRFALPAAAPIVLNMCHIAVVVVGAWLLQLRAASDPGQAIELQTTLVYWLAFFVLVAGVLQWAMLVPSLHAVGFRFRFFGSIWTPKVRQMLKLTLPVALGAGVLQLSVLLDKGISLILSKSLDQSGNLITHFSLLGWTFAYPMEMGAPARLSWAQFLYQFPLGVFAISLATAIFPNLSAEAMDADRTRFRRVLRHGIEATLLEGLPASIGLIIVRYQAIRLLFEHGRFGPADTALVAQSVVFYSMAIWAFSLQQIINRAYYSLHDTKTPLVMSIITLAINLFVEIPLLWPLGEAGMAAGTCISFIVQVLVMLYILRKRVGGIGLSQSRWYLARLVVATAGMGMACWLVEQTPFFPKADGRMVTDIIQLVLLMGVGCGVYFGACELMGVAVLRHLLPGRSKKHVPLLKE